MEAYQRQRSAIDPDDFRGGFAVWSGTSFSAPLFAGKVAEALHRDGVPARETTGTAEESAPQPVSERGRDAVARGCGVGRAPQGTQPLCRHVEAHVGLRRRRRDHGGMLTAVQLHERGRALSNAGRHAAARRLLTAALQRTDDEDLLARVEGSLAYVVAGAGAPTRRGAV